MPGRFQVGEEAIFARLPSSPPPAGRLFFDFRLIQPHLGRRVFILRKVDELLHVEVVNQGFEFFVSEEMLDRCDDRRALIRECWRSHREAGLCALRNRDSYFGMIIPNPEPLTINRFSDDSMPVLGPQVERVEFTLRTTMRRYPEFSVVCEGEEIERLSRDDLSRLALAPRTSLPQAPEIEAIRAQHPELVGALEASLRQQIDYLSQMVLTAGIDHALPGSGRAAVTAFSDDLSVTADGNLAVPTSEQLLADMQRNIFDALRIPERYLRQPETDSDFLARIRRYSGSQADASGETLDEIGRIFGLTRFGVTTEVVTAVKKSIALLKEWLSPEQLEQYERDGYFEVVGGSTGTRYRIRRPLPFNIDILLQDGSVDDRICVEPQSQSTMRPMADGDILLAQKIALEKNEAETLKIANRTANWRT